ncbi:hypothetical protein BC832DRAFT_390167 [Gaertneriomyces semiglobifer]|nr:hypothetical protein BC832DRAFT_390167 [Gaertneriomyces semiglobifer]
MFNILRSIGETAGLLVPKDIYQAQINILQSILGELQKTTFTDDGFALSTNDGRELIARAKRALEVLERAYEAKEKATAHRRTRSAPPAPPILNTNGGSKCGMQANGQRLDGVTEMDERCEARTKSAESDRRRVNGGKVDQQSRRTRSSDGMILNGEGRSSVGERAPLISLEGAEGQRASLGKPPPGCRVGNPLAFDSYSPSLTDAFRVSEPPSSPPAMMLSERNSQSEHSRRHRMSLPPSMAPTTSTTQPISFSSPTSLPAPLIPTPRSSTASPPKTSQQLPAIPPLPIKTQADDFLEFKNFVPDMVRRMSRLPRPREISTPTWAEGKANGEALPAASSQMGHDAELIEFDTDETVRSYSASIAESSILGEYIHSGYSAPVSLHPLSVPTLIPHHNDIHIGLSGLQWKSHNIPESPLYLLYAHHRDAYYHELRRAPCDDDNVQELPRSSVSDRREDLRQVTYKMILSASTVLENFKPWVLAWSFTFIEQDLVLEVDADALVHHVRGAAQRCVTDIVDFFNYVVAMVQSSVLDPVAPVDRAVVIGDWIRISQHLYELRNFATLRSIVMALDHVLVKDLVSSWTLVPETLVNDLERLRQYVSPTDNYAKYRQKLSECLEAGVPIVPIIGLYQSDLTYMATSKSAGTTSRLRQIHNEIAYFATHRYTIAAFTAMLARNTSPRSPTKLFMKSRRAVFRRRRCPPALVPLRYTDATTALDFAYHWILSRPTYTDVQMWAIRSELLRCDIRNTDPLLSHTLLNSGYDYFSAKGIAIPPDMVSNPPVLEADGAGEDESSGFWPKELRRRSTGRRNSTGSRVSQESSSSSGSLLSWGSMKSLLKDKLDKLNGNGS